MGVHVAFPVFFALLSVALVLYIIFAPPRLPQTYPVPQWDSPPRFQEVAPPPPDFNPKPLPYPVELPVSPPPPYPRGFGARWDPDGSKFAIRELDGQNVEHLGMSIQFDGKVVYVRYAVNSGDAEFTFDPRVNSMRIDIGVKTLMGGPNMALDDKLANALGRVRRYSVVSELLTLYDADNKPIIQGTRVGRVLGIPPTERATAMSENFRRR